MKLKDGVFPANSRVVYKYITEILQSANKTELFFLDIDFAYNGAVLDDLEAKLDKIYKNVYLGNPAH